MNAEKLKQKVKDVMNDPAASLQLYFLLPRDDSYVLRLADLEDDQTRTELQALFFDHLNESVIENAHLQICELSTDDERKDALYHYDFPDYPEVIQIFQEFDAKLIESNSIDQFNFKHDDLSKLFGYIIFLGTMDRYITLFKKQHPISMFKRDSFLFGLSKSSHRFERLTESDIVRLDGMIQMLKVNDELYVTDLGVLEKNMGFHEFIQKDAQQVIQIIEDLEVLEDIEVLKGSLLQLKTARQLSKMQRTSPILRKGISRETIIAFTKNTPELAEKFEYTSDHKIRLTTKRSTDLFLKLMNDSFLRSELTKQLYETNSKDDLT